MAQAGLHAAVGYHMRRVIPYEEQIFPAIIFGAMLPDLDCIIVAIASLFFPIDQAEAIFHRTFSHNLFILIFVYLVFAISSEIKDRPVLKSVGKGIALGMLTHLFVDTFFWFRQIDLFWPLPIEPINLWGLLQVPPLLSQILLAMEFFCFRWYAWFLITQHLNTPGNHSWFVKYLQMWKKLGTYICLFFIILLIWDPPFFKLLFGIAYIPSLIMALFSTYMSWESLEYSATPNK